jgi:hypothetical protein
MGGNLTAQGTGSVTPKRPCLSRPDPVSPDGSDRDPKPAGVRTGSALRTA